MPTAPLARRTLLALACLLSLAAFAPDALALDMSCRRHECSNDDPSQGGGEAVVGDEGMAWTPLPGWLTRSCDNGRDEPCVTAANERCYEIGRWPDGHVVRRLCERNTWSSMLQAWLHQPPRWWWQPYDAPFQFLPRAGQTYKYVVRACLGQRCGDWGPKTEFGEQDWVEFVGVFDACVEVEDGERCERICAPGAPRFFPQLPLCESAADDREDDAGAFALSGPFDATQPSRRPTRRPVHEGGRKR